MAVSIRAAVERLLVAWFAAIVLLATGCGGSPTSPTPPTGPGSNPPAGLTIACPPSFTASTIGSASVAVTYPNPSTTGGRAPIAISCTRQSGSFFPLGATQVQCSATDAASATASCSFTVTVAPGPQLIRTRFLAFGDSFTEGEVSVPVPSAMTNREPFSFILTVVPEASYPLRLATLMRTLYPPQASAISVLNSGRSGEWAEDGARRLPGVMASARPEVLLLLEGANDLAALGASGVSRAAVALDTMAKEGRARGARVFMATLPPSRPTGVHALPQSTIVALNDRIRATAAGEGAVLVDLYTALSSDVTRFIGVDGLHPTEAGYSRMAEVFLEAIRLQFEVMLEVR